jgi:death-on-curing protein
MATRHLTVDEVVALHDVVLARMGSEPAALRDRGVLESAVLRPQMAEHYEEAELVRQATLLAIGISQSQAFVDGNKRAAFAALRVFLRLNGLRWTAQPLEMARRLEAVAERQGSLEAATREFEEFLRANVAALSPGGSG